MIPTNKQFSRLFLRMTLGASLPNCLGYRRGVQRHVHFVYVMRGKSTGLLWAKRLRPMNIIQQLVRQTGNHVILQLVMDHAIILRDFDNQAAVLELRQMARYHRR